MVALRFSNKTKMRMYTRVRKRSKVAAAAAAVACFLVATLCCLRMAPLPKAVMMPSTIIDFLLAIEGKVKSYDGTNSSDA